jgi:hypothetical protein
LLKTPYVFRSFILPFDSGNPNPLIPRGIKTFRIPLSEVGFPIRISADQSFFAAPRGFSQRSTSFIASHCQGIHQMPLVHLIALIINAHSRTRQHRIDAGLFRAASTWSLIRKTSLQDRTDNPLRSSTRLTKHFRAGLLAENNTIMPGVRNARGLAYVLHRQAQDEQTHALVRPRSPLGTIFSSRCQISRDRAVLASL